MTTVPESKRLRESSSPSQQIVPRRRPRTLGNAKNGVGPATAHGRSYKTVMVVDGFVQMKTAGPFANESISASTASRSNSQATNGALAAGASVNYTQLAGAAIYPEGNCDPTGRALGPGNDIAVGCREGTTGAPLLVQIMGRTTGVILSSPNGGGGNQIKYDPPSNRYFSASSR